MTQSMFFPLQSLSVIDLTGVDASQILHNLTTNDIRSLDAHSGCESFITDVRGKTLGHVFVFPIADGFRLIGAAGQSDAVARHFDMYTIREDATPTIRDDEFVAFAIDGDQPIDLAVPDAMLLSVKWLSPNSQVCLVPEAQADAALASLNGQLNEGSLNAFHEARIRFGFPWYGQDMTEKNLPQEADRDSMSISFTKGCYLGQETVARLDALGQVQKKLVRWQVDGATPPVGTELQADDKLVGRLTSVAEVEGGVIALGMARRSHFDRDATATGTFADKDGQSLEFIATVVTDFR